MKTFVSLTSNSLSTDTITSNTINVNTINLATGAIISGVDDAAAATGFSLIDPSSTPSSVKLRGITGTGVSVVGSDIVVAGGGGGSTGDYVNISIKPDNTIAITIPMLDESSNPRFVSSTTDYDIRRITGYPLYAFVRPIVKGTSLSAGGMVFSGVLVGGNTPLNNITVKPNFNLTGYSGFSGTTFLYEFKGYSNINGVLESSTQTLASNSATIPLNGNFANDIDVEITIAAELDGLVMRATIDGGVIWRYKLIPIPENYSSAYGAFQLIDNNFTTESAAEALWLNTATSLSTPNVYIDSETYNVQTPGYLFPSFSGMFTDLQLQYRMRPYKSINGVKYSYIYNSFSSITINDLDVTVQPEITVSMDTGAPIDGYIVMFKLGSSYDLSYPVKFTDIPATGDVTVFTDTNFVNDADAEETWHRVYVGFNYYIEAISSGTYELSITFVLESIRDIYYEVFINSYRNLISKISAFSQKSTNKKIPLTLAAGDKVFIAYYNTSSNTPLSCNDFSIVMKRI